MATPPPLPGGLPTNNGYPYDLTYKFNASMAIIVVVLVTTFFFMALFVLYIRRCNMITSAGWGASPTEQQQQQQQQQRSNQQQGLDREALDKLPIMRYSSIKSMKRGKAGPECAVCLLLFEESEKVRVLPDCGHLFHSECIDMWLETHSTCPLCRRSLDPKSVAGSNGLQRALSAVLSSFRREPGVDHEAAEVEADQLPARDLQEPAAAAAVVSRRHDQAGEVVRTLSMHSESFRNAVHDMDLLQVREKLRARSIRVNTTDPGPDTRINVFHHSKSFGGLHHFEEEQDHHDHHDHDHDHQSQEHKDDQNALRRSVSDGESLFRAQDRSNSSSSSHMFSGFASKSKRSLKWLVGSGNSSSAAAAKDDQLV